MLNLIQRTVLGLWNQLLDAGFDLAMAGLHIVNDLILPHLDHWPALSEVAYILLDSPFRQLAFFSLSHVATLPPKQSAALLEPIKPRYWRGISCGRTRRLPARHHYCHLFFKTHSPRKPASP